MLDEKDFQRKADAAFEELKRRLLALGDEHGFDVEGESGKLEVVFEEPEEAKFAEYSGARNLDFGAFHEFQAGLVRG
jgi:frataxin-like iron-binding protein CyaY